MAPPDPIPVTVIAGYLGSGKTTLLNHLLRNGFRRRIAVLVNDFGSIGIDGDLIADADGQTITLTNGCICCSVGSDLMRALWTVRDRPDPPEHVVIEASGIADPGPVAHHALTPGFDLDGVVVVLDAETVRRRERDPVIGRTIRRQLAAADVLVLNKTDLVAPADLEGLDAWLAERAPKVPVLHAVDADVPIAALLGSGHHESAATEPHDHADDYVSVSATFDQPLRREVLEAVLAGLPPAVLRVKGIIRLAESPQLRTVVHRVASRTSIVTGQPWRPGEPGRLVLIALAGTEGLDAQVDKLR